MFVVSFWYEQHNLPSYSYCIQVINVNQFSSSLEKRIDVMMAIVLDIQHQK